MRRKKPGQLTDTELQIQQERRLDFETAVISEIENQIECTTSDAQALAFFDTGIISGFHQGWTVKDTASHIIKHSTPQPCSKER